MTYKTFNPGDILTASDAELLMRQGLIIVSNQAARDAIPAPTEGMRVYRLDTHVIETHDGSTWVPFDTGWVNLATAGAWTTGSGQSLAQIRRIGETVHTTGEVWGGASGSQAVLIPAEFRPKNRLSVVVGQGSGSVNTNMFNLAIPTARDAMYIAGSIPAASPGVSLGGISWARA